MERSSGGSPMKQTVSAETIRETILAGTVAPDGSAPSDLPPAHSRATPEPGWVERDLRASAPARPTAAALPVPALPPPGPLHGFGVGDLLAAYHAGRLTRSRYWTR